MGDFQSKRVSWKEFPGTQHWPHFFVNQGSTSSCCACRPRQYQAPYEGQSNAWQKDLAQHYCPLVRGHEEARRAIICGNIKGWKNVRANEQSFYFQLHERTLQKQKQPDPRWACEQNVWQQSRRNTVLGRKGGKWTTYWKNWIVPSIWQSFTLNYLQECVIMFCNCFSPNEWHNWNVHRRGSEPMFPAGPAMDAQGCRLPSTPQQLLSPESWRLWRAMNPASVHLLSAFFKSISVLLNILWQWVPQLIFCGARIHFLALPALWSCCYLGPVCFIVRSSQ